ncbi:MAG: NlpC/P60 family protein [Bacillota bacterium]|nr:NlpC/P60 family protein [Bacillota bacterium]
MNKKLFIMLAFFALTMAFSVSKAFADYYTSGVVLSQGSKSAEVTSLQNDLKKLGFFQGDATGYFGSYTKQSVINYQRNNYLTQDGVVGHQTSKEIKIDSVSQSARSYYGVPYVWGGTTPSGFDCSGFTQYVMQQNSIWLPRTADQQYLGGTWVDKSALKPGDLVFFSTYKAGPSHVGIYLGNDEFMHASSGQGIITTSELSNSYFAGHYLGAKRIMT